MQNKSLIFRSFLVLICLGLNLVHAQNVQQCDSLIKDAVRLLEKDENLKSITQLTKVKNIANKNNWYLQEFQALNNIGNNYYTVSEYAESLNYYTQAYAIAIKHLKSDAEMIVLNNIAILYSKEKKNEQAKEYFNRALELAQGNKNYDKMSLYLLNLGNLYLELDSIQQAKSYYEQSLLKSTKNSPYSSFAELGLIKINLLNGNSKAAIEACKKLELGANSSKVKQFEVWSIITKAYLNLNESDQAEFYAKKLFQMPLNYEEQIFAFELLSKIAQNKGAYDKALVYKDSIISNQVKDYESKSEKKYLENKSRFEILKYKNQVQVIKISSEKNKKLLYLSVAIIIALSIIIWLSYKNYKTRCVKDNKRFAEKEEGFIKLIEFEKNEIQKNEVENLEKLNNLNLEKLELSKEIELKNRKNSAKALYLAERNVILETMISELSELKSVQDNSAIMRTIKKLKQYMDSDDELSNFMIHFEEINHLFLSNLKAKHPNLNANDIRFLSYVYVNLNTKEISNLLNITFDACRKRKERIIKKLEISNENDLYAYLTSL